LLAELALHGLDVVLTDAPVAPSVRVKAFSHLLGESAVFFFASAPDAARYRRGFPRSLDGAPFLLPTASTSLRAGLDQWFDAHDVRPDVVAEFDDSALLKAFAQTTPAVFAAPAVIENEIERQYGVRAIGPAGDVRERFYAITVERRLKHPAVIALSQAARTELFKS
jgi:LysR family transcriptional activator of nhaA